MAWGNEAYEGSAPRTVDGLKGDAMGIPAGSGILEMQLNRVTRPDPNHGARHGPVKTPKPILDIVEQAFWLGKKGFG